MGQFTVIGKINGDPQAIARAAVSSDKKGALEKVKSEFPMLKVDRVVDGFNLPEAGKWLVK